MIGLNGNRILLYFFGNCVVTMCIYMTAYINIYPVIFWEHNFPKILELWLKSISEMGPAFSQLHHVLHDDTTKACLLTVSLRRSVRSGLLQTSWARSVAHRNARYLFVPCCVADVMSMSTTAPPPPLSRMPQIKCATPWAVSNSDELSTTRQIVVVEHWLFTSQSLWRHGCGFPQDFPVASQQRSEWKQCDGMVEWWWKIIWGSETK